MVNFKENIIFSRFRKGSKFVQGGPTFSRGGGGSNCLFPIETHITCDFPGGSGPPVPPLDPHLAAIYLASQSENDAITSCTCACFPATSLYVFS